VGDRVVNRDLGQVLRLIAKHGDVVFYEGEIAHAIVEDMRRHDGLIALDDLREWRTTRNAPLWGAYRGYRVSSNQPPGGGVMLLEMLHSSSTSTWPGSGTTRPSTFASSPRR
jgi:gamma-glutamyltranspeptidase/glutathione hydrolase